MHPMDALQEIGHHVVMKKKIDFKNKKLYVDPYEILSSVYNIKLHYNKLQH